MKQLISELDDCLGRLAYATSGTDNSSISVFPNPDYDFFPQVVIKRIMDFCSKHQFNFYVDLEKKMVDIYKPISNIPSID